MAEKTEKILLSVDLDVDKLTSKIIGAKTEVTKLKEENKALGKEAAEALKNGATASYEELQQKIVKNEAAIRNYGKEQRNAQRLIDLNTRANEAQKGSYEELNAQWQIAQTELKNMEGLLQRNAEGQLELTDEYIKQSAAVKEAKDAINAFGLGVSDGRMNVGLYANSLAGLEEKLAALSAQQKNAELGSEEFEKLKEEVAATKEEINKAKTAVDNYAEGSLGALERKLEELKEKRKGVLIGSDEWDQLNGEVEETTKKFQEASGQYDEFGDKISKNPAKEEMKTLGDVTQGASSALAILTLVGDEHSKGMQNAKKILAAVTILMQLRNVQIAIANTMDAISIVRTRTKTAVTAAYTIVQRVLNATMNAFPIFAIITGILLFIGILVALKEKVKPIKIAFEALAAVFSAIGDAFTWLGEALGILGDSEEDRADKVLEAQEKQIKAIERRYKKEIVEAQATGKDITEIEKRKLREIMASVQAQIDALYKLQQVEGELSKEKKEKLAELQEQLLDLQDDYYAKTIDQMVKAHEKQKKLQEDLNAITIENMKDGAAKEIAQARAARDKRLAQYMGDTKEEQAIRLKIWEQFFQKERDINNKFGMKAGDDQRKLREQLEDSMARLIEENRTRELRQAELDFDRKIAAIKGNGKLERDLRASLEKEKLEKIKDINEKHDVESINKRVDSEKKKWELLTEKAMAGTRESLDARLGLIEVDYQKELALAKDNEEKKAAIESKYRIIRARAEEQWRKDAMRLAAQRRADQLMADLIQAELAGQSTIALQKQLAENERTQALQEANLTNEKKLLIEAQYQQKLRQIEENALVQQQINFEKRVQLGENFLTSINAMMVIFGANAGALNEFAKVSALFQIGVDTARAITAITAAMASTSLTPIDFALKVSTGVAAILVNAAKAKQLLSGEVPPPPVLGFDSGGNIAFDGGHIPESGGMINGRPHGKGGVRFWMGKNRVGEADGQKGEAYIINTGRNPQLKAAASFINVMGGGKPFAFDYGGITPHLFASGGGTGTGFAAPVFMPGFDNASFLNAIANIKPQVAVKDIIKGVDRVNVNANRRRS